MKLQAAQIQQWLTDVSATHNRDGYADADEAVPIFLKQKDKFQAFFKSNNDQAALKELAAIEAARHALPMSRASETMALASSQADNLKELVTQLKNT